MLRGSIPLAEIVQNPGAGPATSMVYDGNARGGMFEALAEGLGEVVKKMPSYAKALPKSLKPPTATAIHNYLIAIYRTEPWQCFERDDWRELQRLDHAYYLWPTERSLRLLSCRLHLNIKLKRSGYDITPEMVHAFYIYDEENAPTLLLDVSAAKYIYRACELPPLYEKTV